MIRVYCPKCRTPFDVDESLIGEKGLCPNCNSKFVITRPDGASGTKLDAKTTQPLEQPQPPPPTAAATPKPILASFFILLVSAAAGYAFYHLNVQRNLLPDWTLPWTELLGYAHAMFVHFPVVIVLVVAALGVFGGKRHAAAIRILLWINLPITALGLLAGHFAAEEWNAGEVATHRRFGIAVAAASAAMLLFRLWQDHSRSSTAAGLYRLSLIAGIVGVLLAGHYGAELSHGPAKLPWEKSPTPTKPAATPTPQNQDHGEKAVLQAVVLPIMEARCVSCHGKEKQKGELRLDSLAEMVKAGESGKPSIVPGKSAESESIARIKLPTDHDDHMPPSKKPQVTPDELDVLTWWIDAGASEKTLVKDAPAGVKEKMIQIVQQPPALAEAK